MKALIHFFSKVKPAMLLQNLSCLRRAVTGLGIGLMSHAALADGGPPRVPLLPKYQQECAACHVAYPPGLLPAASWQRLLSGLPHHYGTDASLDAASVQALSAWLTAYAGTYKRAREEPPLDRITRSAWFVRKHDEVPASAWTGPAVRSAGNCIACHTKAEQGDFNERSVRIPR